MADEDVKSRAISAIMSDRDYLAFASLGAGGSRLATKAVEILAAAGLLAAPAAPPAISVEIDQEANAAYVKVADGVVFRTAEINNSVNADYDGNAQLLGVEILGLPLAPAAPAARLPTGAASQIATAVHNTLCDCMDNHTGITLRSSDWDLVRDAVAALLESWQGASPATPADEPASPYEVGGRIRFTHSGNIYRVTAVDHEQSTVTFARHGDPEDASTETFQDLDGHVTVLP